MPLWTQKRHLWPEPYFGRRGFEHARGLYQMAERKAVRAHEGIGRRADALVCELKRRENVTDTKAEREAKKAELKALGIKETKGGAGLTIRDCFVCGGSGLKRCTRCEIRRYCSRECQTTDWSRHKPECQDFRENGYELTSITWDQWVERMLHDPAFAALILYYAPPEEVAETMTDLAEEYKQICAGIHCPGTGGIRFWVRK